MVTLASKLSRIWHYYHLIRLLDKLAEAASSSLIHGEDHFVKIYQLLMHDLGSHEKKIYLYSLLRILSRLYLALERNNDIDREEPNGPNKKDLNGVIALIAMLVDGSPQLQNALVDWLAGTSSDSIGQSHKMHRVVIAALSSDRKKTVLQKTLQLFGDKLYIKHTPILHQEGTIPDLKENVLPFAISLMDDSQCSNPAYGRWICPS